MHLLALRQVTLAVGQVSLSTLMKFLFSVEGEYFSALYSMFGLLFWNVKVHRSPWCKLIFCGLLSSETNSHACLFCAAVKPFGDLLILATIEQWHLSNSKMVLNVFWCIAGINAIQVSTWASYVVLFHLLSLCSLFVAFKYGYACNLICTAT